MRNDSEVAENNTTLPFAQTIGKNVSEDQDVWKSGSDPLLVGKEALMEVIRSPPNNTPLCCQPNNRQKNKTKTNKQTILFHFDEYFFCCTNPVKALSMNVLTLYYLCSFVLLYLWLGVYFLTLEPTHSSPMPLASDIDTEKTMPSVARSMMTCMFRFVLLRWIFVCWQRLSTQGSSPSFLRVFVL